MLGGVADVDAAVAAAAAAFERRPQPAQQVNAGFDFPISS